ncbi:hypothetical protein L7F22_049314 [Adiantum nelumboides]|nr:hypothetical protein [Adiantum nelumboides]
MQLVVSPSNFTLIRGSQKCHQCGVGDGEDACIYEDQGYENGAAVPFSWEEKPGVPLTVVNSKYTNSSISEAIRAHRESELRSLLLSPTIFDHMDIVKRPMCQSKEEPSLLLTPLKHNMLLLRGDEEKALAIPPLKPGVNVLFGSDDEEKASARPPLKHGADMPLRKDEVKSLAFPTLKHGCDDEEKALALVPLDHGNTGHKLFPLPPPPKSSLQILTHNSSANPAPGQSDTSAPSPSAISRANAHMKKHRASSFPPFLNANKPIPVSNPVGKPYNELIKEDPFLRAIQACTQPSIVSNNHNARRDCDYDDKKIHSLVASAKNSSTIKNSSFTTEPQSKTHKNSDSVHAATAKDADLKTAKSGFTGNAEDVRIKSGYGAIKAPQHLNRPMKGKEVTCSSNLHANGGPMKAKVYEGHSAFMVAGFQQQRASKQKKHHNKDHRCSSYGSWLSCRSADNHESIVRIHNPRSSFS